MQVSVHFSAVTISDRIVGTLSVQGGREIGGGT